jgi:aspartyl-tRNA(Asn)/glutamyl-tRNA(Gln) amidotransferase subunit A
MPQSPSEYPRLFPEAGQTIAGAGRALREGRASCVSILEACLERVDEWESRVHAWVLLDREKALGQARLRDDELKAGSDRGPLHGIPIGIKDIIDVAGMPTACGTTRLSHESSRKNARVVNSLLEAGAIIMGKTVTTAHAWIDPPITRNPWNLERTPGGSSSGSAAAVACGMCLGAIGSQTGGSITRPASYCGIAGMKPDKPGFNFGCKPLAPKFDQVGPLARSVDDLRLLLTGMAKHPRARSVEKRRDLGLDHPPRLARFLGYFDRRAEPAVTQAYNEALRSLADHGALVVEIEDPIDFEQILGDHRVVMAAEAAHVHSGRLQEFPDDYPPRIRELILEGQSTTDAHIAQARSAIMTNMIRCLQAQQASRYQAVITPATMNTAPDPSTTGDPAFNSPWSYLRFPTVSFPIGLAADGLPVAIQLVAYHGEEFELLRIAHWCEHAIRTSRE